MNIYEVVDFFLHVGLSHCLLLSGALFSIGLFGLLTRRGIVPVLMCVELMLNAVNINFIAFNHFLPMRDLSGQLMAVFSVAVAAAEVAVGVALAFRVYHDRHTVNVDALDQLKG